MKKVKLLLFFNVLICFATAQTNKPTRNLNIGVLYARHGSGDLEGSIIEIGYELPVSKRFSINNNLGFTLHQGKEIFYVASGGVADPQYPTAGLYWNTTGIQTASVINFAVINSKKQKLKIGAGLLARYQVTSLPDRYQYYYMPNRFREPFYVISETTPVTFSVGYRFQLEYLFLNKKKFSVGVKGFVQNSNSDLIAGFGFIASRNLLAK